MPLFQQSVQKKFIKDLDKAKVETAYQKLIAHFGNIDVQENIRKAKEEQYQEGFLRELFVDVLGYVLNPQPNYNLITEQKNEKDNKKADGAILKSTPNGFKPIGIIELKSIKTTDLQAIEIQAFNYKNNQTECVYVVTSNFQKLRFYIENAVDFEEFDLFDLSKERFDLLYLCLQVDNVLSDLPLRIKQASLEREENITKKLYADYSLFKQTLFKDISAQNRDLDKLTLFKKTQKLLDRFLFIFFAEDKGLLPPNSVSEILNQWDKLKELDEYQPLYNRFKKYFGYLNSGHKGKHYDIFAYNGGLFAPDDLLDNLKITDNILYNHCRVLSHYDFDTEVDTNILGHIFEHSLNEVDEVAANTEGVNLDKGKTKRKKDGIFYTPRYITKYIVESTVGELCKQKKLSLGLDNEALVKADTKKDRKLYQVKIDEYRKWLLQLTILDPACGSGAFLNQALEFLLQEHRLVDTMTAMLFGDSLIMTDNVTEILENNIFGVDINEESVEIARLSLWLRTAKVGRKLNDLSRNIKCGNSLISDPSVAGDLAFDWKAAFPQVFAKGGFDVIIGNPPYGASFNEVEKSYLKKEYENVHVRTPESYNYFISKIQAICNPKSNFGVIIPSSFLNQIEFEKSRKLLLDNGIVTKIINLGDNVFDNVATPTCIIVSDISKNTKISIYADFVKEDRIKLPNIISNEDFYQDATSIKQNSESIFIVKNNQNIIEKCYKFSKLKEIAEEVATGVSSGLDKAYVFTKKEVEEKKFETGLLKNMVIGGEINRYLLEHFSEKSLIYIISDDNINLYPNIEQELLKHKETLLKRREAANGKINWYALNWARRKKLFEEPKILIRQTANKIMAAYDEEGWYCLKSGLIVQLPSKSELSYKYLLAILNSKLMDFLYQDLVNEGDRVFPEVKPVQLFKLPIAPANKEQQIEIDKLVEVVTNCNIDLIKQTNRFIKLLQSSFSNLTVNKKIETWYEMKFGEFRKELEKQKIAIPIKELMDYQDLFDTNATQIKEIQTKINNTEKAIDKMVYALYDLTDEEIQIIEKNN